MAVSILTWPGNLEYKLIDLLINARSASPGKSITGSEQISLVNADLWTGKIQFPTIPFNKYEGTPWVRHYRAWIARLDGRYGVFKMPVFDGWFGYGDAVFGAYEGHAWIGQPFSDGTYWFGDVGFDVTVNLAVTKISGGTEGSVEIVLNFGVYGDFLRVGQYFCIDSYLYITTEVWYDTNGDNYIKFKPPLRRTHVGATIPFEWPPYLVSRFTEDLSGRHELDFGIFTAPTVEVEEFRER